LNQSDVALNSILLARIGVAWSTNLFR